METDMVNGVNDVKTAVDGDKNDRPGPRINGTREKMSRGTASHKAEEKDGREPASLISRLL